MEFNCPHFAEYAASISMEFIAQKLVVAMSGERLWKKVPNVHLGDTQVTGNIACGWLLHEGDDGQMV